MTKYNERPVTVPTEQTAAYEAVENGSSGFEPQSDGTRDVADSGGDEPQVSNSASNAEQLNSEMKEEELKQVSGNGTASHTEENAKVVSPKADKESKQKNDECRFVPSSSTKNTSIMEEKNLSANPLPTGVAQKELLKIAGELSPDELQFCKDETEQILNVLSPKQFAKFLVGACQAIDLTSAEESGEIIIARLDMNRKPKAKAIEELYKTILEVGTQIMCLVIPATVAVHFGYRVTDFEGNPIPEDKLCRTIVIFDGQTRYYAIQKIRKENPDKVVPRLYAYFPLHWVRLDKMLQAINLKVFTWSNSDFMTGVLSKTNISADVKTVLEYIQKLEGRGYNYTAACEFVTLEKGIIRKCPLVKAMSEENPCLTYERFEFGLEIHKAAITKFSGKNEDALKSKTIPELIIGAWEKSCKDLSQKEATRYIITFLEGLGNDELLEIVSPSEYKRGCGKKKEVFVKKQFEKSFKAFMKDNPYAKFKNVQDEETV